MIRCMKTMATALLVALGGTAVAQIPAGPYRAEGKGFDGQPYAGTAQIVATSNDTCRIVWRIAGEESRGTCMRSGNTFVAGYVLQGKLGLVIYDIRSDGSMQGRWTIADENGVGTERLTPGR